MTRGWLPQRAGLPSLNGGGAAATFPMQNSIKISQRIATRRCATRIKVPRLVFEFSTSLQPRPVDRFLHKMSNDAFPAKDMLFIHSMKTNINI